MSAHPVQMPFRCPDLRDRKHRKGEVREQVAMAAYEVYAEVYGPQPAMITDGCRGGFAVSEYVALLYARGFPREEWRQRVDEAFVGMRLNGDGT